MLISFECRNTVELVKHGQKSIVLLDAVLLTGGWLLGPELLGWLFHLDLTPYRPDLLLILLGGGFFALYTMMSYGLVAMAQQKRLWLVTLGALIAVGALNAILVPRLGLRGAALGYLGTMILAAALIFLKTVRALRRWEGGDGHGLC